MAENKIESTGKQYNKIILEEKDFVPSRIYKYQIKKRNRLLAAELKGVKVKNALDLGCGTGFHSQELDKHTEKTLILSDLSKKALSQAAKMKFGNKVTGICCDASNFKLANSQEIGLVHIAGMLHHIPSKADKCISSFSKYTRKGSLVIVDEPNKFNPLNFFLMRLSKADPTGEERPLSAMAIAKDFKKQGYAIKSTAYYGFFVPPFLWISGNKALLAFFERLDCLLAKTPIKYLFFRWRLIAEKQ